MDIKHKIEQFALDNLVSSNEKHSNAVEAANNDWSLISSRKWELKYNGVLLGTIFHKPNNKYSLWFSVPNMCKKVFSYTYESYQCDSFDEAKLLFNSLLKDKMFSWCKSVVERVENE